MPRRHSSPPEEFTPEPEDYTISDARGGGEAVGQVEGDYLGKFNDRDAAEDFIVARMDQQHFWPNVWWVSDHGNYHLLDLRAARRRQGARRGRAAQAHNLYQTGSRRSPTPSGLREDRQARHQALADQLAHLQPGMRVRLNHFPIMTVEHSGRAVITLRGARGARYNLIQNIPNPLIWFIMATTGVHARNELVESITIL
jgi:hypothetical protein